MDPSEALFDPMSPALGVCTSIVGHRLSLTGSKIHQLAAAGATWLELSALQQLHLDLFDEERLDEIHAAIEATGVNVWSIHCPFCGFAMDDEDTRIDAVRLMLRSMEVAKRFGGRYAVVHPGRDVPSIDRKRELTWTREAMARAADAAPEGVAVALETMGARSLAGPPEEMLAVLDGIDPLRVGVCFDTGHVHQGADVPTAIRTLGERIVTLHLHDNHGDRDEHNLPGRGTLDWPMVLRTLKEVGYDGVLMCEGGQPDLGLDESVKDFADHMIGYCRTAFGT